MRLTSQALLDAMDGIAYLVGSEGIILQYGRPNWEAFAVENGATELAEEKNLLGRNIFEFISGEEVRTAYAKIMAELRLDDTKPVILPCRCDSPAAKREQRMAITPLRMDGFVGFLYQVILVDELVRPPLDILDFKAVRAAMAEVARLPLVAMCSYCQEVRSSEAQDDEDGVWIEASEYYRRGGKSKVQISHTICPSCYRDYVEPNLNADRTSTALA